MATKNVNQFRGEVVKEERFRFDCYVGSGDDLVSEGLIRHDQLPGQPGCGKMVCTYVDGVLQSQGSHGGKGERCLKVRRLGKDRFEVSKGLAEQESKRRLNVWHAERTARELASAKQAEVVLEATRARRDMKAMPSSGDEFRRNLIRDCQTMLNATVNSAVKAKPWHGYTITEEARGDILMSFDAIVEAILNADVRFDRVRHDAATREHLNALMASEPQIQSHLQRLVQPNPSLLAGAAS